MIQTSLTLPNRTAVHPSQDYEFLRREGLRYLEKIAGRNWTDFNSHDPGITILEVLCYALTELGYRASLPVEELIADGKPGTLSRHFLVASRAIPGGPVTERDFRKLLLDIPGVLNVWLSEGEQFTFNVDCTKSQIASTPVPAHHVAKVFTLRGIHNILVQTHENETDEGALQIKEKIKKVFHAHRNLCEDLGEIAVVSRHDIRVCADVELLPDAAIEKVHAAIIYGLQQHFNPPLRRYTLSEMLDRGTPVEKIYEGPLLSGGFIDDDELENSGLKTEIRVSDLIRVIMGIPGVRIVRKIHLNDCQEALPSGDEPENWILPVKKNHLPNLCEEKSRFKFFKGTLPFKIDGKKAQEEYAHITKDEQERLAFVRLSDKDLPLPEPRFLDTGVYTSIQHDLPQAYGTGRHGVPETAPAQRTQRAAQARQLRAYLLFFDQILADFMAQLAHTRDFFETGSGPGQSYFHQVINDLPGIEDIYRNYPDLGNILNSLTDEHTPGSDGSTLFEQRRNKMLDHLLARFCESFNDYVLLMHTLDRKLKTRRDMMAGKMIFLNEYETLSSNRFRSFDYFNEHFILTSGDVLKDENGQPAPKILWYDPSDAPASTSPANISGLEHRVARLGGLQNILRRNLSGIFYDLYEEFDTDTKSEIRFRIVDTDKKKILLSSSKHYATREEALEDLRRAVQLSAYPDNCIPLKTSNGRYYFNVMDKVTNDVLARRIEYFSTTEARDDAIEYLVRFIRENYNEEGLFVVEHLLLRPRKAADRFLPVCCEPDCPDCDPPDPYSYRVHVVLPGYTPRFSDMNFRNFFEQTIRMEIPAHIMPRICWIGIEQMSTFEACYRAWIESLHRQSVNNQADENDDSLNNLLHILGQLHTIYPEGYLHDCKEGDERNPVVLGQTRIGTLTDSSIGE